MTTFNFNLLSREIGTVDRIAPPPRLRIPLSCQTPVVDAGVELLAGDKVGRALKPESTDLHTPLPGKVIDIRPESILIETTSGGTVKPIDASSVGDSSLVDFLADMGICPTPFVKAGTIIINAVPTEPGITVFDALLRDYRKTVKQGLDAAKRIIRPSRIILAAPRGDMVNTFNGCSVTHLPPVYPNGLDAMVIKAITGQEVRLGEMPRDAILLNVLDLYLIGRVMETGLPATETVMTVGNKNLRVPIGMPVRFLLDQFGYTPRHGDRIVLGGLMQGLTAGNIKQGVHPKTMALNVVSQDRYPPVEDRFCMGCGECVRHCPARILPNMISRAAEFKLFDRAEQYYINACIECGICGYVCKTRRPILQYIRFAKQELALLKGACEVEAGGET